jgi:hypothetical protein
MALIHQLQCNGCLARSVEWTEDESTPWPDGWHMFVVTSSTDQKSKDVVICKQCWPTISVGAVLW